MVLLRLLPTARVRLLDTTTKRPASRRSIVQTAREHFAALEKHDSYEKKHVYMSNNPWCMDQVFVAACEANHDIKAGTVILETNPFIPNLARVTFTPISGQMPFYGCVVMAANLDEWLVM